MLRSLLLVALLLPTAALAADDAPAPDEAPSDDAPAPDEAPSDPPPAPDEAPAPSAYAPEPTPALAPLPDRFRFEHASGAWVEPIAYAQIWMIPVDMNDPDRNDPVVIGDPDHQEGITIRRVRFGFTTGYRNMLSVRVMGGWQDRYDALQPRTEFPTLLEAYGSFTPFDPFAVDLGVQFVPFGRQARMSSNGLALFERAMVSQYLGAPREPGIQLRGALGPKDNPVLPERALRWYVGAFNGGGDFTGDRDPGPRIAARLRLDLVSPWEDRESHFVDQPFGLSVGGSFMHEWALEADTLSVGADLGVRVWRVTLLGELMYARAVPTFDTEGVPELLTTRESMGWYGQVGVMIVPDLFEIVARVDGFDDNLAIDDAGNRLDITGGVNVFFFDDRLKLQLDYVHRIELVDGHETTNDTLVCAVRVKI